MRHALLAATAALAFALGASAPAAAGEFGVSLHLGDYGPAVHVRGHGYGYAYGYGLGYGHGYDGAPHWRYNRHYRRHGYDYAYGYGRHAYGGHGRHGGHGRRDGRGHRRHNRNRH